MSNVKNSADLRSNKIQVTLTDAEKEAFGKYASDAGFSLSSWLRSLGLAALRSEGGAK